MKRAFTESSNPDQARVAELEAQLREAREALDAIQAGDVDAVVVGGPGADARVYTLKDADRPYRVLIERMLEGATTLSAEGSVLYCNPALAELLGVPAQKLVGRLLRNLVRGDQAAALDGLLDHEGAAEFFLRGGGDEPVPVQISVSRLPVSDDIEAISCAVVTDLTETKRHAAELEEARTLLAANAARADSEEFSRRVLDSSSDCIKVLDLGARMQSMNEGGLKIMEVDDFGSIEGCDWRTFWSGEEKERVHRAVALALGGEVARFQGYAPTLKGTPRWWDVVVSPINNSQGAVDRLLAVSRDITDQKRAEQERELLINELNHRVKNTLATVQSIGSQTLRGANVEPGVRAAFEDRLILLASAHDVLTEQSWKGAGLREIVTKALAPFKLGRRAVLDGPDVRLPPKAALAIAMTLHELATNAVKYGALLNETGVVALEWSIASADGERRLHLRWTETGGPTVKSPQRSGFGSRLIERGLAGELEGEAHIEYRESGVVCSIEAPLAATTENR